MRVARAGNIIYSASITVLLTVAAVVVALNVEQIPLWAALLPALVVPTLALRRPLRRLRAVKAAFPRDWRTWLEQYVPIYTQADESGRRRFERDVQMVLAEARFDAVDDVELDDELRLSVAAGVATLLHGRRDWELDLSRTFLFYPDTFDDNYQIEDESDFDGMVHPQGPVLLSRQAALEGWHRPGDGSNVILHELAHLFDFADQANLDADGIPTLLDRGSQEAWQKLARREMALARRGRSILGRYAATHPAEFFAVGTERFFEIPGRMAERHPDLFEAFSALYNLDPRRGTKEEEAAFRRVSLIARRRASGPARKPER